MAPTGTAQHVVDDTSVRAPLAPWWVLITVGAVGCLAACGDDTGAAGSDGGGSGTSATTGQGGSGDGASGATTATATTGANGATTTTAPSSGSSGPTCGDEVCDPGETFATCPEDARDSLFMLVELCPGVADDACACWDEPTFYTSSGHPCVDVETDCYQACLGEEDACVRHACILACERDLRTCVANDPDCETSAYLQCIDAVLPGYEAAADEACGG